MTIRAIQSDTEYKAALREAAILMGCDPEIGTPQGDRLDVVVTMVQSYEAVHMSMETHVVVNIFKPGE